MNSMFGECLSLKELNISNFKFNSKIDVENMFSYCSTELIKNIGNIHKNIKNNAFNRYIIFKEERNEDDFRRYDIIDEDNYEINDINNYGRYEEEEHSDIDIDHIGDIDDFDD